MWSPACSSARPRPRRSTAHEAVLLLLLAGCSRGEPLVYPGPYAALGGWERARATFVREEDGAPMALDYVTDDDLGSTWTFWDGDPARAWTVRGIEGAVVLADERSSIPFTPDLAPGDVLAGNLVVGRYVAVEPCPEGATFVVGDTCDVVVLEVGHACEIPADELCGHLWLLQGVGLVGIETNLGRWLLVDIDAGGTGS